MLGECIKCLTFVDPLVIKSSNKNQYFSAKNYISIIMLVSRQVCIYYYGRYDQIFFFKSVFNLGMQVSELSFMFCNCHTS